MKVIKILIIIVGLMMILPTAFAGGKITGIDFLGPDNPNSPNIVQIQIEGGFNNPNCDTQFAAIRNTVDRKDLISFALTAYATKEPVDISLNGADKYFGSRCTISRISSVY